MLAHTHARTHTRKHAPLARFVPLPEEKGSVTDLLGLVPAEDFEMPAPVRVPPVPGRITVYW